MAHVPRGQPDSSEFHSAGRLIFLAPFRNSLSSCTESSNVGAGFSEKEIIGLVKYHDGADGYQWFAPE